MQNNRRHDQQQQKFITLHTPRENEIEKGKKKRVCDKLKIPCHHFTMKPVDVLFTTGPILSIFLSSMNDIIYIDDTHFTIYHTHTNTHTSVHYALSIVVVVVVWVPKCSSHLLLSPS